MMKTSVSVFIFISVLQVIVSQDTNINDSSSPIDHTHPCSKPPRGVRAFQCCPLPPMHNEEEFKACDFGRPNVFHECTQKLCMLKNKGLLNEDDTINLKKMDQFLTEWSKDEPRIQNAVEIAKKICFDSNKTSEVKKPPAFVIKTDPTCEADKLYHCVTASIIWNCQLNENCSVLKKHIDTCKPLFF